LVWEKNVRSVENNTFCIYQENGHWIVDVLVGQLLIILHAGGSLADVVNIPIWAIKIIDAIEKHTQDRYGFWRFWEILVKLHRNNIDTGMNSEDNISLYFCVGPIVEDHYNFMLEQQDSHTSKPSAILHFTGTGWETIVDGKIHATFTLNATEEIVAYVQQLRDKAERHE